MGWRDDINCKNLVIARKNIGLSTQEATNKVAPNKKELDKVALWEAGQITNKSPTYKQLEGLANRYNVSVAQFFLQEDLDRFEDLPAYRSQLKARDSYYLKRFINLLRTRQQVIRHNMQLDQVPKNSLVGSGRQYTNPQKLAELIGSQIGYYIHDARGQDALKHLRSLLEAKYIFVFKNTILRNETIDVEEMRGIYLNDQYAPVIALNRKDSEKAQLFTLAHELVHLFRGSDSLDSIDFRKLSDIGNDEEAFCNQVAACLLMPESEIPKREYDNIEAISRLSKKFQVSNLACFYRLKTLGYIDRAVSSSLEDRLKSPYLLDDNKSSQSTNRLKQGFSPYPSIRAGNGNLFNEYIFSLHLDNRLSAVEAQNLLRLPLGDF